MPECEPDPGSEAVLIREFMASEHVREVVRDWPPITERQRADLARLILASRKETDDDRASTAPGGRACSRLRTA